MVRTASLPVAAVCRYRGIRPNPLAYSTRRGGAKGRSRRPECGASRYANSHYGKDAIFMTTALRLEAYAGISALSFLRKLTEIWNRVILIGCGPFPDSKGGG